jgi:N-terminal domain of reverse transcriptase
MNVDKLTYPGLIVNKFGVGRIMPNADQLWDEWRDIDWKTVESYVWKLQKQIYRASLAGNTVTVHTVQKRLLRSYFAKLLAVRKVSQENQGKRTAGVDGVKALTPKARFQLASRLSIKRQPRPIRRVYIPYVDTSFTHSNTGTVSSRQQAATTRPLTSSIQPCGPKARVRGILVCCIV